MKEYICQSCGAYLEPDDTIQYRDEEYDELYITCPYCGGDCRDPEEEEALPQEALPQEALPQNEECQQDCEDCLCCITCEKSCNYAGV